MYTLKYTDEMDGPVRDEFHGLIHTLHHVFDAEHENVNGGHKAITVDSIASRTDVPIPIDNGRRLLSGPLFLDLLGNSSATARIRPPQITANQNDYNPVGLATALVLQLTSDAARDITGIQVTGRQQRLLIIGNVGGFNITLKDASASSAAANRFDFPADIVIAPMEYKWLIYDTDNERWHRIA